MNSMKTGGGKTIWGGFSGVFCFLELIPQMLDKTHLITKTMRGSGITHIIWVTSNILDYRNIN